MIFQYHPQFKKSLKKFSEDIQDKFYKQAEFLLRDIRYPSLHAKKYNEVDDVWQARVDKNIRFYFKIQEEIYLLIDIKNHPK